MSSVQIYTNTSSSHFATTTGDASGAKFVTAANLAADTPSAHFPRATKPDATAFPNSLFIGSSLNYLRIKLLTTRNNTALQNTPQFYVFGWSRELSTGWWEARLLSSLKPGTTSVVTNASVNWTGVGTVREIFQYGTTGTAPDTTPHRGDSRLYQSFSSGGGGHFLIDTIGTELVEIHFTQAGVNLDEFAALCAGL